MKLDPIRLGNDVAKIVALATVVLLYGLMKTSAAQGLDLSAFWSAARLALAGQGAQVYDPQAIRAVQQAAGFSHVLPFLNPPPFLLLSLPLGLLSYPAALVAWNLTTFAVFFLAARSLFREGAWMLAIFAPVLLNLIIGQNGLVTGALFIGAILALDKRPILAGVLAGALVIKPQLALLFPVAFIAGRQWRAFIAAAVSSLGLLAVSELAFPGIVQAFLASAADTGDLLNHPALIRKLHSVYGAVRMVGAPVAAALSVQVLISLTMAVVTWRIWRSERATLVKGAALALAAPLATPYVYDYDLVLLALPLAVLARPAPAAALGLYVAPMFTRIISMATGLGLAPVVMALALWRLSRVSSPAQIEKPAVL